MGEEGRARTRGNSRPQGPYSQEKAAIGGCGPMTAQRLFSNLAASIRAFESEETKAKRLALKRQKELRAVTERISAYARTVHKRFPTGDVVVSECDLAEQLRKRTDVVVTALNLLLSEQKVHRAPLSGYWHVKVFGRTLRAANTNFAPFDFRRLKTKFPYIMLIPQTKFL